MEVDPVSAVLSPPKSGLEKTYDAIESVYDSLGLMTGEAAEARRFAFGAILGSGIMHIAKPSISYDSRGNARPWALLQPSAPNKTALPWWMPGLALGFFSGFLV